MVFVPFVGNFAGKKARLVQIGLTNCIFFSSSLILAWLLGACDENVELIVDGVGRVRMAVDEPWLPLDDVPWLILVLLFDWRFLF